MPFQTTMYANLAPGIEGDWASANPRFSQLTGPAPIIAGFSGVTVGRFAWLNGNVVQQPFGGGRIGFVHRDQPSLIVPTSYANWLPASTMVVPPGLEVILYDDADVWVRFAAGAIPGQKVYAYYADGTAYGAATATAPTITASSFTLAAVSPAMSMTGSIANGILTITAATTGKVYPGTILSGAGGSNGVAVITGTQVLAQITPLLTGEATGGIGRYLLNYDNGTIVQSSVITGVAGLLTIVTTGATTWNIGQTITASDVSPAAVITANVTNGVGLTGNGGTGTYIASGTDITGSTSTLTGSTAVETAWYVDTYAGTAELAKISQRG